MHGVISPPTQVANQTTLIGQNPASVQAQAHQVAALSHRLNSNPFIRIPSAPNLALHHMTPTALRKLSSLSRTWPEPHTVWAIPYGMGHTINSKLTSRLKLDSAWFRSGYFKDPERPEYVQSRPPIANQFVYREKRPRSSSDQSASSEPCSSWTDEEIWIIKSFCFITVYFNCQNNANVIKYKTLC